MNDICIYSTFIEGKLRFMSGKQKNQLAQILHTLVSFPRTARGFRFQTWKLKPCYQDFYEDYIQLKFELRIAENTKTAMF